MVAEQSFSFHPIEHLTGQLLAASRIWLFLDYDGTLAEFAPTPADIFPNPEIIKLLSSLAHHPMARISIISGRRLDQIQALVPVPGIMLAGTYGVELQVLDGGIIYQAEFDAVRPALQKLKTLFEGLIAGRNGFYIEDKGWAIAIHARYAEQDEADEVIEQARSIAVENISLDLFRLLGGHKFFEVGSRLGNKGQTVAYLIDHYPWTGASLVYVGDDDKDEEAFEEIKNRDGHAVLVSKEPRITRADYRLESPEAVRTWLASLDRLFNQKHPLPGHRLSTSPQISQDP